MRKTKRCCELFCSTGSHCESVKKKNQNHESVFLFKLVYIEGGQFETEQQGRIEYLAGTYSYCSKFWHNGVVISQGLCKYFLLSGRGGGLQVNSMDLSSNPADMSVGNCLQKMANVHFIQKHFCHKPYLLNLWDVLWL